MLGTAIETPIKIELKFTVLKDKSYVKTPHFKAQVKPYDAENEYYCTTGVSDGTFFLSSLLRTVRRH